MANIYNEYKWKKAQKNIGELNSKIYKKGSNTIIKWDLFHLFPEMGRMIQYPQINEYNSPH